MPNNIDYGVNPPNIIDNANIIFGNCEGKMVKGYEIVEVGEIKDAFTGSHGIEEPVNQIAYIEAFRILLSDEIFIEFRPAYDYGQVTVYEKDRKITTIQWKDLKTRLINISNEDNIYEMEKNIPEEEEDK